MSKAGFGIPGPQATENMSCLVHWGRFIGIRQILLCLAADCKRDTIGVVVNYRITRVNGKVPHWRIECGAQTDLALTTEDAMSIVGEWLRKREGGEFRILWENTPVGFEVPDLEYVLSDPSPLN
jgi:hypothetical protein